MPWPCDPANHENDAFAGGTGTRGGRVLAERKGTQADHRQEEGANGFEAGHGKYCGKEAEGGGKRKSPRDGTIT